uniref:protein ACCELERATED CELL DEATH 6-like n=1 Tax=Erigeron canadensis TaxID=72917 RepID=UPI001CB9899F|nr:protein ACCELERATED CELL DEATH 6-like [Erigeron canadensis]
MSGDKLNTPDDNLGEPFGETDITLSKLLYTGAQTGNTIFVIELLRMYPTILWIKNRDPLSIFHIAVMHRHKDIYNLVYEIGSNKTILTRQTDDENNCILHLVGSTSKRNQLQTVSAASLLMQRELLWFKEVEKITPRDLRYSKNNKGQTPYDLFSENNEETVSKGLKWTRDCMVVATLIITIAFAAAFTIPGGYNQEIGLPIFTHETSFLVFLIADSVSLFSSSTSLLVFLSILTSPYGPRDFLYSLPRKLMIGLVTLFISVAAMMVTFAASFFVMYHNTFEWLPILISIFAAMPVIVFASLQYPLLMDMFRSMYDSRYLFKPKRRMLYDTNQQM